MNVTTPMGARMLESSVVQPSVDSVALTSRQNAIDAFTRLTSEQERLLHDGMKAVGDIDETIANVRPMINHLTSADE